MWQRFTERARRVVFFAQEEAGRLGENYVSTEHLLLGLVRENDSVAARILDRIGVSLGRVRSEIERQVARGDGRLGQDMQLTPRAKRVIDLAYDEARQLNNNYIGTEHLLLGLIREGEGLAGRILAKLGVDLERTRREVMQLQDAEPGRPFPPTYPQAHEGIGDVGELRRRDHQDAVRENASALVEVARDVPALRELVAVFHAKDRHGYRELVDGGSVWLVAPGTRVRRLEPPADTTGDGDLPSAVCYVRVLDGEHAGKAGWVLALTFRKTDGADEEPFPPPVG